MKKLVIITGASSGIGASVAKRLSSEGYPLLLLARRLEKLEELNLPNTICRKVDVLDIKSFQSAIKEAEELYGSVDCLVNNAGIMLLGHADTQNVDEWNNMIDINLKGLLNGIHLILKEMKKRNCGTIINISSDAGRHAFPNYAVYCATKFGVHALSEAIRQEVAQHSIRVSIIAPGEVETELMSHNKNEEILTEYQTWKETVGQGLQADDIAYIISYIYNLPQYICIRELVVAPTKHDS